MFSLRLDDSEMSLFSARVIPRETEKLAHGRGFHDAIHMVDIATSTASGVHTVAVASEMLQGALPDDKLGGDPDSDSSRSDDFQGDASPLYPALTMPNLPDDRHALRAPVSAHAERLVKRNIVVVQSVAGEEHPSAGVAATILAPERPQVAIHDPRYAILASQWAAEAMDRHPVKPKFGEIAHPNRTGVMALATGGIAPEGDVQPEGPRLQLSMPDRALHAEFAKGDLHNISRETRLLVASPVAGLAADSRRAESRISDVTAKPDPVLPSKTAISGAIVQAGVAHEIRGADVAQTVARMAQHDGVRTPSPQDIRAVQGPELAGLAPVKAQGAVPQNDAILADRVRDMRMVDAIPSAQVLPEHAILRTQGPVPLQLPHRTAEMLQEQVIAALSRPAPNTVQIQLDPIELGRVRISLQASESGMQVHVMTERPETLDLLRKFSVDLLRDLSQMGYKELTMSFSDQREREKPFNFPAGRPEKSVTEHVSTSDPMQIAPRGDYGGVDIRV